jgi:hypothetical protein
MSRPSEDHHRLVTACTHAACTAPWIAGIDSQIVALIGTAMVIVIATVNGDGVLVGRFLER